jgi:hypothetical protein
MPFIVHCPSQVVITRSSERGDSASNHRNLHLGDDYLRVDDDYDIQNIINGEPVSSSIC